MKNIITKKEIQTMSYTDFVSLIKEENRPSGGKKTIRVIAQNAFVTEKFKVLEVGSTNGFSSMEIAKLTNCDVTGVDINSNSVKNANLRVSENGLDSDRVKFKVASVENLPFPDEYFDLIICGNALSFVSGKNKAMEEIVRVCKPNGFISIVPIWYIDKPSNEVLKQMKNILGFDIPQTTKNDWRADFLNKKLELYFCEDYKFDNKKDTDIEIYLDYFFRSKTFLDIDIIPTVRERWREIITGFRDNLYSAAYSIMLFRKNNLEEEIEMFTSSKIGY